jgi:L-aspartate oxidase
VHGANRLASNSLLEGLVFGARAGKVMRDSEAAITHKGAIPAPEVYPKMNESRIRQIAWEYCGISRDANGLTEAKELLASTDFAAVANAAREHYELRNIHTVALLIARCALAREESRGGHYRKDFPETRPEFQKHSHVDRTSEVSFA